MQDKIFFPEWQSFGTPFLIDAFRQAGYEIERQEFPRERMDTRSDAQYAQQLVRVLMGGKYAFVFTFNYFPIVAVVCKACRIPYVSWTYDSPFVQLYSKTLSFDTNFVFVFDRHTVDELRGMGYGNVYYLPMAAPGDGYGGLPGDGFRYQCDVAFVGSLYSEDFHNPFRKMRNLEGYYKGMIDGLLQAQKKVYGYPFLQEILTERPDLVEQIAKLCPFRVSEDGLETIEWVYANYYLYRQLTAIERQELLERMGERFHTCVYTPERCDLSHVEARAKVDYYTEAPYVYHNSRVNLNITLRSIHTGIPLRAFDIMASGGFLLSNWQEDFAEYFEDGAHLALYQSAEEAVDKAAFYLKHETLRQEIAERGRALVLREHTYLHRVRQMCSYVEAYWG